MVPPLRSDNSRNNDSDKLIIPLDLSKEYSSCEDLKYAFAFALIVDENVLGRNSFFGCEAPETVPFHKEHHINNCSF